ncbi:hypothetical protein COP2_021872 [Malus domestica]
MLTQQHCREGSEATACPCYVSKSRSFFLGLRQLVCLARVLLKEENSSAGRGNGFYRHGNRQCNSGDDKGRNEGMHRDHCCSPDTCSSRQ